MDKYYIPKSLDEPFRIFLLTIDELLLLIVPIVIMGFFLDQLLLGVLLGLFSLFGIKKIKGEQGHYFLLNLAYWYLPRFIKFKVTPPSYIKEYIG